MAKDVNGIWYFPFDSKRYRSLLFSVSVEPKESVGNNERESVALLSNLFEKGAITAAQFIKRLPRGILPDAEELIEQMEVKNNESL